MLNKKIIGLLLLFLLACVLRFYNLAGNPPALTWDEAAWGYNAYTLGIDGKDEFGRLLPYDYLESFGDFKPPVYAYLDILPVKLFGLNEFAVRVPSALLGSVTVLVTYFLVLSIFSPKGGKKEQSYVEYIAFTAAGILAISPWHIMLSRAAFEANVATFFIASGVCLFFYGIRNKPALLVFSAIAFVVSMYTFNTARIVAPLLVVGLFVGCWKELFAVKKHTIIAAIVGVLLLAPQVPFLVSPQAKLRFQEVNIFSDISVVERSNQQIANDHNAWWSKIIHNRRIGYSLSFANHYLDNLKPDFLFFRGDGNPKFSIRTVGQMFLWEIPFLIVGTFMLFRKRERYWWIIPYWLIIGIIPAATARETPHALRIEATLPTFQILVAYGVVHIMSNFKYQMSNVKLKYTMLTVFGVVVFLNLAYFLHGYYMHYPYDYSGEWQYGYKQAIEYVKKEEQSYDEIRMTTSLGRPYAYYLFYLQTHPEDFRKTALVRRNAFGFVDVDGFGKYRFSEAVLANKPSDKRVLYVDKPEHVPGNARVLETIRLLNGKETLKIYSL